MKFEFLVFKFHLLIAHFKLNEFKCSIWKRDKDFKTHQSFEGKCTVILFNDEVSTRLPNEEDKVYKM